MLRKTKIVCTIGPASESEEVLEKMMKAGMNVARFNFSHGTQEEQIVKYQKVVKVREKLGLPVATLFDSKGPEIRFRLFEGGKVTVCDGDLFTLTTTEVLGTASRATISYKNLVNDVSVGTTILVNDGIIELKVESLTDTDIVCRVIHGGVISDRKAVNVPDVHLSMPFISDVDRSDLIFAMKTGYEFFALSFVRCAADVLEVKALMKEYNCNAKIISKIENKAGIDNLDEIISVSDGIMVARGDMGVEIPFAKVPVIQKEMIEKCEKAGKYVIIATQMLESMINNPRPTRAEVNDIANAIFDKSSAIMLSGESAAGKYPVEAVSVMNNIAVECETSLGYSMESEFSVGEDLQSAVAYSAVVLANRIKADAIVALSVSGSTIRKVSAFRPDIDVIGCSVDKKVCYETALMWGVTPLFVELKEAEEELLSTVKEECIRTGLVQKGSKIVVIAGFPLKIAGTTNTIKVLEC